VVSNRSLVCKIRLLALVPLARVQAAVRPGAQAVQAVQAVQVFAALVLAWALAATRSRRALAAPVVVQEAELLTVSPPGAAARVAPQGVVAVRPVEVARVGAPRPEVAQVVAQVVVPAGVAQQAAVLAPQEGVAVAQQAAAPWALQAAVRLSWVAEVVVAAAGE